MFALPPERQFTRALARAFAAPETAQYEGTTEIEKLTGRPAVSAEISLV